MKSSISLRAKPCSGRVFSQSLKMPNGIMREARDFSLTLKLITVSVPIWWGNIAMQAKSRYDLMPIKTMPNWGGFIYPDIDCRDYETFKDLPSVIEYIGQLYAKSAYNSDTGTIAYRRIENHNLARSL